jgi:hypothetical protein
VYIPAVGYCQGLNFIAGLLLMISGGNEVETFYATTALLKHLGLEWLYTEGMPLLAPLLRVFDTIFERKIPNVYDHFQHEAIPEHMWFGRWLLTLGADSFPLPVVIRLWD